MNVTKITELLTIDGVGKEVVLDGFDFTENGYVKVLNAKSVLIQNCRVYGLNVDGAQKNYWFRVDSASPVKVVVRNCFLGDSKGSNGSMYNLFEPHVVLSDGSSFSENYFTKDCCTHNAVNIYGVAEGAHILVNDNVFEVSAGTVRVGPQGEPHCTIEVSRNKVLANNERYTEADFGIVTVQPYGKQTPTFKNMTVLMDGNSCPSEQLIYGYSGAQDTTLNTENMPTIYVDGEQLQAPIYH